jgi:hypothetical protein
MPLQVGTLAGRRPRVRDATLADAWRARASARDTCSLDPLDAFDGVEAKSSPKPVTQTPNKSIFRTTVPFLSRGERRTSSCNGVLALGERRDAAF